MTRYGLALTVAAAVLFCAPAASAYTGAVTRAHADTGWTRGSLAGYVNWTDCGTTSCSWIPVASVQPSLPEYRCLGSEALDSDPNTFVVWNGGGQSTNHTAAFDLPDTPILSGVYGQRLCVSVIETRQIRDPVCVAQAPILGMDPNACPLINQYVNHVVATALLTVPLPSPIVHSSPAPIGEAPSEQLTLRATEARRKAARALGKKFGGRYKRGSAKRMQCIVTTLTKRRCKVSWRFEKRRYKGIVTVAKTSDGVSTRVRVKRVV